MAPGVALYAGFFPRYNRLMGESGFPEAAQAIRAAWERGDHDAPARAVPDALSDAGAEAIGRGSPLASGVSVYVFSQTEICSLRGRLQHCL
jgi:hypothetical protein